MKAVLNDEPDVRRSLLCRVRAIVCALPVEHVSETMRPLPVAPLAGAPAFVLGVAVVRGEAVPVVDVALLLGVGTSQPTRFVTVKAGARRVALAVDAVCGVSAIPAQALRELPPLLRQANPDALASIGTLDAELLLVLRSACLVPESLWASLGSEQAAR